MSTDYLWNVVILNSESLGTGIFSQTQREESWDRLSVKLNWIISRIKKTLGLNGNFIVNSFDSTNPERFK